MTEVAGEDPAGVWWSWEELRTLAEGSPLPGAAVVLSRWSFEVLVEALGPGWLAQMREAGAPVPGIMVGYASYVGALPRLVAACLGLKQAVDDGRFTKPLRALRQAKERHAWDHFVLQAEVARAAAAAGNDFVLDPFAGVGTNRADVLVTSDERQMLVEVTTLHPPPRELIFLERHRSLGWAVDAAVGDQPVSLRLDLHEAAEQVDVEEFIERLRSAAAAVVESESQEEIVTWWCRAVIAYDVEGGSQITGVPQEVDAWARIDGKLRYKTSQLMPGPRHVWAGTSRWIRLDVFTGFFGRTDWAALDEVDRLEWVSALVCGSVGGSHVDGVVLSAGAVVDWGPDRPDVSETQGDGSVLIRAALGPGAAREAVIVPTSERGTADVAWWSAAYRGEAAAIDSDLAALSLPPLSEAGFRL